MTGRIVTLQPAAGWWAVHLRGGSSEAGRRARFERDAVAVWALIEDDDGVQTVIGMEAGGEIRLARLDEPAAGSFSHYWYEGSTTCACASPEPDDSHAWCTECAGTISRPQ